MNSGSVLRLGNEELIYLLRALQAPAIPGVDLHPFEALAQDTRLLILASAAHSLEARQMIEFQEDGTIVIDKFVLALIGTCSLALESVLFETYTASGMLLTGLHQTAELTVQHRNHGATHEFSVVEAIPQQLEHMLGELWTTSNVQATLAVEPFSVHIGLLQQARQAILHEEAQATQLLKDAGIPDSLLDVVYGFFQHQTNTIGITTVARATDAAEATIDQNIVLNNPQHCFVIQTTDNEYGVVRWCTFAQLLNDLTAHFQQREEEQHHASR